MRLIWSMIKNSMYNMLNLAYLQVGLFFRPRWQVASSVSVVRLIFSVLCSVLAINAQAAGKILVHTCPLAGAQFHALGQLHDQIQVGDELRLVRDPQHKHDALAIRVEWQGQMLGYIPRADNPALAAVMDQGHPLTASVATVRNASNPWQRMEIHLYLRWD